MVTKPIKVDEEVKKILDKKKIYPRETYNDVIRRILELPEITGDKNENSTNM